MDISGGLIAGASAEGESAENTGDEVITNKLVVKARIANCFFIA